jgi:magnesium-transporting ATPase (P-type)
MLTLLIVDHSFLLLLLLLLSPAGIMLAAEPPEPSVMDRPPRRPGKRLLVRPLNLNFQTSGCNFLGLLACVLLHTSLSCTWRTSELLLFEACWFQDPVHVCLLRFSTCMAS